MQQTFPGCLVIVDIASAQFPFLKEPNRCGVANAEIPRRMNGPKGLPWEAANSALCFCIPKSLGKVGSRYCGVERTFKLLRVLFFGHCLGHGQEFGILNQFRF